MIDHPASGVWPYQKSTRLFTNPNRTGRRIWRKLMDLLDYQYMKIDFVDKPLDRFGSDYPLDLYCSYTLDQILVALGKHTEKKKSSFREGVLNLAEKNLDVFFVTLNKSEKDYSHKNMVIRAMRGAPCFRSAGLRVQGFF